MMAASALDKAYWIVVADEAHARIYARKKKYSAATELLTLENPSARARTGDLIADRGGRSFDSHGQGRHTMVKEKADPKAQLATKFAKEIAERVSSALQSGECLGYVLVAAPRFLGTLRSQLAIQGGKEPYLCIDKDVVGRDVDFVEKLVAEHSP